MGPRARRRLTIGVVALLVLAGAITAVLITGSGGPSRSTPSRTSPKVVYGTFGAFGISYGWRPQQVLTLLGAPDQKAGGCWIYRIRGATFHGNKILPQIAGMDAVRYCFSEGVVQTIEDHWVNARGPFGKPWVPPTTWGCGGGPCHANPNAIA